MALGFVSGFALSAKPTFGAMSKNVTSTAPRSAVRRASLRMQATETAAPVSTIPSVAPAAPKPYFLSPPELFETAVKAGVKKGTMPVWKLVVLGMWAGFTLSMAAMISLQVGKSVPGITSANPGIAKILFSIFGLPMGLTLVSSVGAELFTGNTATCSAAWYKGKISLGEMLKNWVCTYSGNFLGGMAFLGAMILSGMIGTPATQLACESAIKMAAEKTAFTFSQAFVRGIICNWLVCMAVWLQMGCHDFVNKMFAIILANATFIMIGFEHSIANMFYLPFAIVAGADLTWAEFLTKNLIPVTLGNIVGGMCLVSGLYYICHDQK